MREQVRRVATCSRPIRPAQSYGKYSLYLPIAYEHRETVLEVSLFPPMLVLPCYSRKSRMTRYMTEGKIVKGSSDSSDSSDNHCHSTLSACTYQCSRINQ